MKNKLISNSDEIEGISESASHTSIDKYYNLKVLATFFMLCALIATYLFILLNQANVQSNKNKKTTVSYLPPSTIVVTVSPSTASTPIPTQFIGQFDVEIKAVANDERKSAIFLRNKETKDEIFFTTVDDVYKNHYHRAEYHNGNLYLIVRPGGENESYLNPQWTDELIRINLNKQEKKLFSEKGVDFRVSADETRILNLGQIQLTIMDFDGKIIKTLPYTQLTVGSNLGYSFLAWGEQAIWLDNAGGPVIEGIVKLDMNTYQSTKYNISNYKVGTEYTFNPKIQKSKN